MPLPTTDLALHWKASDGSFVYENVNGGGAGVHTGNNPAADAPIEVVENQPDGSLTDVALVTVVEDSTDPLFKAAGGSAMKKTSLLFDGSNDRLLVRNQDNSLSKEADDLINAGAGTWAVAFRASSITANSANPYSNQCLVSGNDYWGIAVRDSAGTKQCEGWIFDSAARTARVTIAVDRTYLAFVYWDGANVLLRVFDDTGALLTDTVAATGNIFDVTGETVIIGGGTAAFFHGFYSEGVFYDANKVGSERTDLEQYFKDEWLDLVAPPSVPTYAVSTPRFPRAMARVRK